MMKKRLSKTIWYGSDVDSEGNPIVPPVAKDANDLEGLHHGELYLHQADDKMTIWSVSESNKVLPIGVIDKKPEILWEVRGTENGEKYIWTNYPVVTQQGVTMYADGSNLNLPSIYAGIPIDNDTIYWEETTNEDGSVTKILKAKGVMNEDTSASFENVKESGEGNAFTSFILSDDKKTLTFVKGDSFTKKADFDTLNTKVTDFLEGSDTDNIINKWKELEAFLDGMKESDDLATILATKWTKDDAKIANWDAAFSWGDHSKKGYALKTYVDETFVTIGTEQTITGKKNFTRGGLFVNGSQIVYDSTNGYWKLDGDLLVTGAITMFANEGKYTPSTIMDAIATDNLNLKVVNGVLTFVGQTGGGVADSVAWNNVTGKPTWISETKPEYNYSEIKNPPTIDDRISDTSTNAVQNKVISSKSFISGRGNIDYDSLDLYNSSTNPFRNSGSVGVKVYDSYGTHQHSDSLYTFRSNGSYWGFEIHQDFSANSFRIRSLKDTGGYTDWKTLAFDGDYLKLSGGTMAGTIKSQAIYPKITNAYELGTSSYLWSNLHTKKVTIDGIEIKKSNDGVVYLDGNLVVTGAVTMFGTDSVTASTVMDGVNVDGTTIIKSGNKLMLNPDLELGGGGINSLKVKLGTVEYDGVGTTDVVVSLPAYPTVPTSLKNPNKLTVTLADGSTKVEYDGSIAKSITLTRLYKADEVVTATTDEGTITPLAMNQWTTGKFPLKDGTGATGTWGISISGNANTATTASKLSTLNETAWGQTYWTSGGVPTSISGNMSNVGSITPNAHNGRSIGANNNSFLHVYTNYVNSGDSSLNNLWLIGGNVNNSTGIVFARGGTESSNTTVLGRWNGNGLTVNGNLLTTGGITMYGSSDKRLKKNIRTFQAGKELMSLGGVYQFEYEDEEIIRNAMYKGTHVGLIYQNVKGTILDKMCYERGDGYGALNYLDSSFISLLAGVGVEHETRIQRLERENKELRKEIEQLKKA